MCAATSAWAAITRHHRPGALNNRNYLLTALEMDEGLGDPAPALLRPLCFVRSDGYKSSKATPSKKLGRRDSLLPPSSLHILLSPPAQEVGVCGAEGPAALVRLPLPTGCSGPSELAQGERKRSFGMQVVLKQLSQPC